MTLSEMTKLLKADIRHDQCADRELFTAFAGDMLSDVLALGQQPDVLLTGLVNPQVIRTAEMMDIICIVFVRGKEPDPSLIELAKEREIALLASSHRMFSACGLLYEKGLRGGGEL